MAERVTRAKNAIPDVPKARAGKISCWKLVHGFSQALTYPKGGIHPNNLMRRKMVIMATKKLGVANPMSVITLEM